MPEESTTPDLVELTHGAVKPGNSRDLDAATSFYASDAVLDASSVGLGTFEGLAAIRGFFEDWIGSYAEFEIEPEQVLDLGNGVAFTVVPQSGRPTGSTGRVQVRYATVLVWEEGVIVRCTNYIDIDEARAAAERLAEERG